MQRRPYQEPQSLVILKPCCVGDVLLATPVLAALRQIYPHARIAWAVGAWSRPILEHHPRLDELIDAGPLSTGAARLADAQVLAERLRQGHYDTCFILDRSPLLTLAAWLAGISQRIGLDSAGRGFADTIRVPVQGVRHEAELYLDTLRAVEIRVPSPRLEFFPSDHDRQHIAGLLAHQIARPEQPIAIINPAGGENPGMKLTVKRWPPERFALLAGRLVRQCNAQIILVGGPNDLPVSAAVRGLMASPVVDLTGELAWGQLGALCERATLYVGNDTGATHLAVAMGCRVLAIFGPTDPRRYGPFASPDQAIVLWHPTAVPGAGVAAGAAADFSWDRGVTADEAFEAALQLLDNQAMREATLPS